MLNSTARCAFSSASKLSRSRLACRKLVMLPLSGNARAKMDDLSDGFVKLFCRPASGQVIGGVVVAPRASELILPITMAVENNLTVNELAQTLAVYPSLSGSITEASRRLMAHDDLD